MLSFEGDRPTLRVPLRTDELGLVRVGTTRVSLGSIIACFHRGATPEQIVQDFSAVSLPDVYAVIAYYLQEQAMLDAVLAEEERVGERLEAEARVRFPQEGIRERLLRRKMQWPT